MTNIDSVKEVWYEKGNCKQPPQPDSLSAKTSEDFSLFQGLLIYLFIFYNVLSPPPFFF